MARFIEAVPGTAFLLPIVWYLVSMGSFPVQTVIAIAAFLVFPMGWILLNIQGFMLAYRGRYENEPIMGYIRGKINVESIDGGKRYYIDLSKVLPKSFRKRTITCCKQEYEKIFDPFRILRCFPWSFRRKQEKNRKKKPYYVENIENITYFSKEVFSSYIREVVRYWHISTSSGLGFLFGILVTGELFAILNEQFSRYLFGIISLGFTIGILLFFTALQSHLRKREAIANEFLLMKLLIPYTNAPPSTTLIK